MLEQNTIPIYTYSMPVEHAEALGMLKRIHLFRGIDEMKLSAAVDFFESIDFKPGAVIYQQDDDSEYFNFLLSGRLKVSRYSEETHQSYQIGVLEEDDYFGQEVLEGEWLRQVTVEAETEAVLLRLDENGLRSLLELIPPLGPRLQLILDSYHLMLKSRFTWLDPVEYVYFIARRHVLFMFTRLLLPLLFGFITIPLFLYFSLSSALATTNLILLTIAALITIGWGVWGWIDWANDYYIISNRRVIHQERVVLFYDSRQESPMDAVQSTSINTSQIGRILGYGNVAIRTYTGTLLFRNVSNPEQVMGMVQEQQIRAQTSQRRAELRQMESLIERQIGSAPPAPLQEIKTGAPPPRPSSMQRFLSDLLHLRVDIGGTILYRTHWFRLLQKIWLPSLLILGNLTLWFLSIFNLFTILSFAAMTGLTVMVGMIVGLWWLYQYLDWHNDVYLITQEQIVDVNKKPLGKEERRAAPIKNILSIEYHRLGIIGLILNFGTIYIRVGDQELTFDDVFNPSEVQRELFNRMAARQYAEKQAAQQQERQRMTEWIAAYHRVQQRTQTPRNPPARGGF